MYLCFNWRNLYRRFPWIAYTFYFKYPCLLIKIVKSNDRVLTLSVHLLKAASILLIYTRKMHTRTQLWSIIRFTICHFVLKQLIKTSTKPSLRFELPSNCALIYYKYYLVAIFSHKFLRNFTRWWRQPF